MSAHFTQIFWGLVIVAVNISINHFDFLPDGLGYFLVAIGCAGLVPLSPRFATARLLAWILAAFWLVGFAVPPKLELIYGVPFAIVNCVMMWQLLGGIGDVALDRSRPDLAERASNLRIAYIAVMGAATLLAPVIAQGARELTMPFVVVTVVAGLVVLVMILQLVRRVRSEWEQPDLEGHGQAS